MIYYAPSCHSGLRAGTEINRASIPAEFEGTEGEAKLEGAMRRPVQKNPKPVMEYVDSGSGAGVTCEFLFNYRLGGRSDWGNNYIN